MRFLLYGAYGYTGRLIVAEAVRQGWQPVLAGRDGQRLQALAERWGLSHRTVALEDGEVHPGFQTSAKGHGADWVLSLPGVRRWDGEHPPSW
ncbi:MAG TPA: hypothetical protein G4O04_08370 [Anaerolineae bacterium]|nr:hypothetical protein [Anaerolineae bacterium]